MADVLPMLGVSADKFGGLGSWSAAAMHELISGIAAEKGISVCSRSPSPDGMRRNGIPAHRCHPDDIGKGRGFVAIDPRAGRLGRAVGHLTNCPPSGNVPRLLWGHSSAGRALAWHARGRRFDPAWLHQIFATIYRFSGLRPHRLEA
jgi:hypothetical protein